MKRATERVWKFLAFIIFLSVNICISGDCTDDQLKTDDGYLLESFQKHVDGHEIAKTNCEERKGWLVRIKDDARSADVNQLIKDCESGSPTNADNDFYIGLHKNDDGWKWNDGTALTPEQERWREDDNGGEKYDCACVRVDDKKWADHGCDQKRKYICQSELLRVSLEKDEVICVKAESCFIDVKIESKDGPFNITVYKLLQDTKELAAEFPRINNETIHYVVANQTEESDGANYLFEASKSGSNGVPYKRNATATVIVHVPTKVTQARPKNISSPVTIGPNVVECITEGIPTPQTTWLFRGVEVSENVQNGVYQTKGNTSVTLNIENATISDDGIFSCKTTNLVGESKREYSDSEDIKLTVYGKPTILSYAAEKCAEVGRISVDWMSNNQTKNIFHRIKAVNTELPADATFLDESSTGDKQTSEIGGLSPFSTYYVTVRVCPDKCIEQLSDSAEVTTGVGIPAAVQNAAVTKENSSCIVSWVWTDIYSTENVSFEIVEVSSLVLVSQNTAQENANKTCALEGSTLQTFFKAEPNRQYSFTIFSLTCAGRSEGKKADGDCITDVAAPNEMPTPESVPNDSTKYQSIKVTIPDETNGPIGCFFVIVISGEKEKLATDFSEKDLKDASAASKNSTAPTNVEYVAVAIERNTVNVTEFTVNLGDETSNADSECNINQPQYQRKRRNAELNGTYSGYNWLLKNGETYSYYIVSTTPSNGGPLFQQSPADSFEYDYNPGDSSVWIIVGTILAVIAIGIIILAVIYYRRFQSKQHPKTAGGIASAKSNFGSRACTNESAITEAPEYASVTTECDPKVESTTKIDLKELKRIYEELASNEGEKFSIEFSDIKTQSKLSAFSTDVASRESLRSKNRYKNILPYDVSRVILSGSGDETYINASYVHGYAEKNKFIATQGPLMSTVDDFWRMVAETRCQVIVMLTKAEEAGKKKCEKYWPEVGNAKSYNSMEIRNHQERILGGYRKRLLEINLPGSTPHVVMQYQFLEWPDHGVPRTTSSLMRFHEACIESRSNADSPIIVHCSAGAGRTGTFIGYDNLLEESGKSSNGSINVRECVMKMRQQRMDMVQTRDQYTFLHRLMLESHLFPNTDSNLPRFMEKLENDVRISGDKSTISTEFDMLAEAASLSKLGKLDSELEIVIAWQPGDGNDIVKYNASGIKAYESNKKVIAAQGPTLLTMETFWRVVLDTNVHIIVMLNNVEWSEQNQYWPSEIRRHEDFGQISVELSNSREMDHAVQRSISVKGSMQNEEVKQYQIVDWTPEDVAGLITDIRNSTQWKQNSPMLVHCSDGLGRTGVVCALFNLIARYEVEKKVDVFRTVKDLQDYRPGLVLTLDQYRFCYKVLASFVESSNVYENRSFISSSPTYENVRT